MLKHSVVDNDKAPVLSQTQRPALSSNTPACVAPKYGMIGHPVMELRLLTSEMPDFLFLDLAANNIPGCVKDTPTSKAMYALVL